MRKLFFTSCAGAIPRRARIGRVSGGLALPLAACLFLFPSLEVASATSIHRAAGANPKSQGLSSLSLPAQGAISAVLGRGRAAYHATGDSLRFTAKNPKHGLTVNFRPAGIEVALGAAMFGLRLEALGYGARLEPAAAAAPQAKANRVEYRRGNLTEWYANGPLGVQQGFTLQSPPAEAKGGSLTLALALSGDLKPALDKATGILTLATPSGQIALRYRGLTALDATGRELPARLDLAGDTLKLEIDDASARYPLLIDPFIEAAKFLASDGLASDHFGASVAISGDTVVVGADFDDIGLNNSVGSAYVFVKPATGWANATENAHLTASDGGTGDLFGESVSVSGDTVVIGAEGGPGPISVNQGAAYVFVKPAGGWADATETAKLTASDGAAGEDFGFSVGIDGDTVAVGARQDRVGANNLQGSAFIFVKPIGGWADATESAKLTASDGLANDFFGSAIAISGDTVVVGAPRDTVGANTQQGSAYVFVKPVSGWVTATETAKLTASDGAASDLFGDAKAVAVNGDTVVMGAPFADIGANTNQGSAYVYVKPVGGWTDATETAKLTADNPPLENGLVGDNFGIAVGVSGDTVVVGNLRGPGDENPRIGSALVFVKPAGGWASTSIFDEILRPLDLTENNQFANSVAIDGDTIVAGRPVDSTIASQQGSAYVFVQGAADLLPDAVNDVATTNEDTPVTTGNVLANDALGDTPTTITAFDAVSVQGGAVVNHGDGTFTYTPTANFNGGDSFTYTIADNDGDFSTATVTITVNAVNDNPVAADDAASVSEDGGAQAIPVLSNDGDPDGDALSISAVTQGAHGAVIITGGGTGLTYTPNANYNGPDTFTYTVSDGHGGTDTATVTVTVNAVNDNPVAADDAASVSEDGGAQAIPVLSNDGDPDGDAALSISAVTQGAHGAVIITGSGTGLTYTPNANYNGPDTFTYTVSDGHGGTDTATVTVTVNAVDDLVHDLAIVKLTVPKTINLKGAAPSLTKNVVVQIQNRGDHDEKIENFADLGNLVEVEIQSLGEEEGCPAPVAKLIQGPPNNVPHTLKSKKKVNIFFDVTFNCANHPDKTTKKNPNQSDYSYTATVHHSALDGNDDSHTLDDTCPRNALGIDPNPDGKIKDKGCGKAKGGGIFGNPVLTDVVRKK